MPSHVSPALILTNLLQFPTMPVRLGSGVATPLVPTVSVGDEVVVVGGGWVVVEEGWVVVEESLVDVGAEVGVPAAVTVTVMYVSQSPYSGWQPKSSRQSLVSQLQNPAAEQQLPSRGGCRCTCTG